VALENLTAKLAPMEEIAEIAVWPALRYPVRPRPSHFWDSFVSFLLYRKTMSGVGKS
jgi:hypothetical protein